MRIRHEKPQSDLSFKVRAPLKLTLETGKIVAIENWSLLGLTYPEKTDILPKAGVLSIPFQGVEVQFDVRFSDGQAPQELQFENLTGRQRETLAIFYRSILSGKMASSEEVITSLDTPVDLVPMGETEEEETKGRAKAKNRVLRILWNVTFYLVMAFLIFGVIGNQIFSRISHVSLAHGRIIAPLVVHRSTEAGFIDTVHVQAGDQVRRGDILVELDLPDRDAELDDIREDIGTVTRDVDAARVRLETHRAARTLEHEQLRAAFLAAHANYEHLDYVSGRNLTRVVSAQKALQTFEQETRASQGAFFNLETELQRSLTENELRLSRLKRDLGNKKDSMDAINIVALSDGIVQEVAVFEDQYVARGTDFVVVEEDAPRVARAWLNEARSDAIFIGMETTIRFNDGGGTRSLPGRITDVSAGVDPATTGTFGVIVDVTFDEMNTTQLRDQFQPNAPVTIRAVKDWGWISQIGWTK